MNQVVIKRAMLRHAVVKHPIAKRFVLAACALLLALPALAASSSTPLPKDSVYQLPLVLIDQDGKAADWSNHRGKPQVVSMFYTSCPYMCPLIVDAGKGIEHTLTPAQRKGMGILLISMDPGNDTPAALMALATKRKLDTQFWSLAAPQPRAVSPVAGVLGVRYRKLATGGFNHTSVLILLDRNGRIVARTEQIGGKPDPEFLAALRRELDRS